MELTAVRLKYKTHEWYKFFMVWRLFHFCYRNKQQQLQNHQIMKKLLLPFFTLVLGVSSKAQNIAVNNDGTAAATSAMLDVKSINKGFLMPRVTTLQRTAITSPALGLLVFDTDTKTVWAYDGTSWKNLYTSGGLTLPFSQTVSTTNPAFAVTNSGTAIEGTTNGASASGIRGIATVNGSNGVYGGSTAANGVGVRGESNTGTGVIAYSGSGFGINASSLSGTGLYTSSTSGLALNVNGNLKIAGGNTNPSNGAVLTSDASGNAVWKANRVAFKLFQTNQSLVNLPSSFGSVKMVFAYENYDFGNNILPYEQSGTPPVNVSTFTVPVDGVYHFDATATINFDSEYEVETGISLVLERNGQLSTLTYVTGIPTVDLYYGGLDPYPNTGFDYHVSGDFLLFPGDKVYVALSQRNVSITGSKTAVIGRDATFSGHLVMPY
jgi:hypothetical protein